MKNYYTESEYKKLIKNMVILVDTAEKENEHILKEFDKRGVEYKRKSLKTGDYSFMIKACPELGFLADTYFVDELCIERKNSVDELAANISTSSKDDNRFFKELNRMINIERVYLLIENGELEDILDKNYISKLNEKSFLRTILTWQSRNDMKIYFVKKGSMARMIYELCKNCLDSKILK